MEKNEDGGVTFTFSDSNDPYITLPISSQVKINAEEYPYFALYLKTNYVDASGEMFFVTADSGISGFTGGYSVMFDYCDTEGNQVAVVDFSDAWDYAGAVQQFRFDAYDGGCGDPEDVEMTVYAAAFFKNYNDALMFKVEGVNVELDPEYVEYAKDMMEESGETEPATEQKPVETNAETEKATEPAVQTDAPKPADTNKTTEKAPVQPGGKSSNTWIIYVIIGVVAAAAAAVVIIMVTKKKK